MQILWFKIMSLLVIFFSGLIGGILPTRINLSQQGNRKLVWSSAFAAGIFLGAGLLHMLPDAVENFKDFAGDYDFPFPTLICGIGFLFVLILEKAVLGGNHDIGAVSKGKPVYPFLLCFILSIHSIIAGTTLGLEMKLVSATAIFIAIIAHKGAAAFALGVSLKERELPTPRHIAIICAFSFMTPLGVILGTLFSTMFSGNIILGFEFVFDALAAGTFLYVAIVEILKEVFEKYNDRWIKTFFLSSGFALMALVAIWT